MKPTPTNTSNTWVHNTLRIPAVKSTIRSSDRVLGQVSDGIGLVSSKFSHAASSSLNFAKTFTGYNWAKSTFFKAPEVSTQPEDIKTDKHEKDADKKFLKTIANDTKVKIATDGLLSISALQSAYAKWAGVEGAQFYADYFYSPNNPLFKLMIEWPGALLGFDVDGPLTEESREEILKMSGYPDFVRTPFVVLRYGLMMVSMLKLMTETLRTKVDSIEIEDTLGTSPNKEDVKQKLAEIHNIPLSELNEKESSNETDPQLEKLGHLLDETLNHVIDDKRIAPYAAKAVSETGRAFFTIADFTAVSIGSAYILSGDADTAIPFYVFSLASRILTGATMATSGVFGFIDANREDKIKAEAAAAKNEKYASNNPAIRMRAFESTAIAAAMIGVSAVVLADYSMNAGSMTANDGAALLKSSAAALMPLWMSLGLGGAQSLAGALGVWDNAKNLVTPGISPRRRKAYAQGIGAGAIGFVGSYFYAMPIFFGVGAGMRVFSGTLTAWHLDNIAKDNKEMEARQKAKASE